MDADSQAKLEAALEAELSPHGFVRHAEPIEAVPPVPVAWVRKTWNTNRGVIVVSMEGESRHVGEVAQALKIPVGKQLGYFPFLYGMGLQVVCVGRDLERQSTDLESQVDRIDNQRSIVQSLHVLDLERSIRVSGRTWGQAITGRFIDAIERGLDGFLSTAAHDPAQHGTHEGGGTEPDDEVAEPGHQPS